MSVSGEYPKKQVTIKVTQQEEMTIEVYQSPVDGLVVHRQVRWAPGKDEHKFTSKWQVTHEPSGLGLLTPTKCLPRQKDAFKFAKRVAGLTSWPERTAKDLTEDEALLSQIKSTHEAILREQEAEESGEVVVDEEYKARFYVERNRETRKHEVRDRDSGEVAEDENGKSLVFSHRGRAWKEAHRLNEQAGVS